MKEIPLTKGKRALIDDVDFDNVSKYKWHTVKIHGIYYAFRSITIKKDKNNSFTRKVLMHRVILNAKKEQFVDHKDGNGLNNTKENLRLCTRSQNGANSKPQKRARTSKYKGVVYNKSSKHWIARAVLNKKSIYLGAFDSEVEAAKAYDKKSKELHGEFARPNFNDVLTSKGVRE